MTTPGPQPLTFDVANHRLLAMLHPAALRNPSPQVGLIVLVGGPQYRVGPHRQYRHLAMTAAAAGIPSFRFDYCGVGDSEGAAAGFEAVAPEIHAALDQFFDAVPSLKTVVLWGLCEGASSILLGASQDPRVGGIVLVNPWVRRDDTAAAAQVQHYYGSKWKDLGFWKRVFTGQVNLAGSVRDYLSTRRRAAAKTSPGIDQHFSSRMAEGLKTYKEQCCLIMSERDLTAREFDDRIAADPAWQAAIAALGERFQRVDMEGCDHTFSSKAARNEVAQATIDWISARVAPDQPIAPSGL